MFNLFYFLKRLGIVIIALGVVYPIYFYFQEGYGANHTGAISELTMAVSISLGVILTGVIVMLASESLKRKSTRALLIVTLIGAFNVANALLLISAFPGNAIAYLLGITGFILSMQYFRIKHKLKTLA